MYVYLSLYIYIYKYRERERYGERERERERFYVLIDLGLLLVVYCYQRPCADLSGRPPWPPREPGAMSVIQKEKPSWACRFRMGVETEFYICKVHGMKTSPSSRVAAVAT